MKIDFLEIDGSAMHRAHHYFLRLLATACSTVALVGLVTGASVHAAPLTPIQEKNVRMVVQNQLAALADNDAARAFSFAAPNVRQAVRTAPAFMAMVRRSYPAIYRPASVAFLKPEGKDGQAIQRVQMLDADGDAWLAVYSLELQKDKKTWRITGCHVAANKGRMA